MQFAREPFDGIMLGPTAPARSWSLELVPPLARCEKPFFATISSPARSINASIFASSTRSDAAPGGRPGCAAGPARGDIRSAAVAASALNVVERLNERGDQRGVSPSASAAARRRSAPPSPHARHNAARWRRSAPPRRRGRRSRPPRPDAPKNCCCSSMTRANQIGLGAGALPAPAATPRAGIDDANLIRHQTEDACKLRPISRRNGAQAQIAGERVELRERRPGFARLDMEGQQIRHPPHQARAGRRHRKNIRHAARRRSRTVLPVAPRSAPEIARAPNRSGRETQSGSAPAAVAASGRPPLAGACRRSGKQGPQTLGHHARIFAGAGRQGCLGLEVIDPSRHLVEAGERLIDHGRRRGERPAWIAASRSSAACSVRPIAGSSTTPAEPLSV